jgi:uncharacterized protein YjbK
MTDEQITSIVETERKYDVNEDAIMPKFAVGELSTEAREETIRLSATYFDTDAGALASRAITFRRRTGGHDEGWHLKTPGDGGRIEHHSALSEAIPERMLESAGIQLKERLIEVARIVTARSITRVIGEGGGQVAEIADDRVTTTDLRTGDERSWREWEVELAADAPRETAAREAVLDEIEVVLLAAGATPSRFASKLARGFGRTSLLE